MLGETLLEFLVFSIAQWLVLLERFKYVAVLGFAKDGE